MRSIKASHYNFQTVIKQFKKIIPLQFALWIVIALNSMVVLFHFLVLIKIIPFTIVWGGQLDTEKEMYVFESISILINCFILFVVLMKGEVMNFGVPLKIINALLWILVIVFALNTIGNLASETNVEKLVATPLTFILAILCSRLAIDRNQDN